MKLFFNCLFVALMATTLFACQKSDDNSPATLPVSASTVAGNFTVSSFTTPSDLTATFNGYAFVFNQNGTITATKGSDILSGTWMLDDSNASEMKISFSAAPLNQLNGSWHVVITGTNMVLTDDDDHNEDAGDDHPSSHDSRIEFERD